MNQVALLTREQSSAFKGVLILLIVLGHNSLLMTDPETQELRFVFNWLYLFHVQSFFILPFMYGKTVLTKRHAVNNFVKLYAPYLWIFTVCLFINAFYVKHFESMGSYLYAFTFGNIYLIKEAIGFYFPWFLPAMFSLLILKGLYDRGGLWQKSAIAISTAYWLAILLAGVNRYDVGDYIPLSISQAFYFLPIALVARKVSDRLSACQNQWVEKIPALLAFIGLTLYLYYSQHFSGKIRVLIDFLLPVAAFSVLFAYRKQLGRSAVLQFFGKYSMPIYLFHVIIYNAIVQIVHRFKLSGNFAAAVAVYILTLAISIGLTVALQRREGLYSLMFPQGIKRRAESSYSHQ